MNSSSQFNSHVLVDDLAAWKLECNPIWDRLLGTSLILSTLVGAPANVMVLKYFRSKRDRNLSTKLYIAICCIDICTCVAHFPVTISLFSDRYPVLFNNMAFCMAWAIVFKFLQRSSMFLVMLLSISRCIAVALPFRNVNKNIFFLADILAPWNNNIL